MRPIAFAQSGAHHARMIDKRLLMAIALAAAATTSPAAAQLFIRDGRPIARIYVPTTPPPAPSKRPPPEAALLTAVRELNYHLEKMSGTRLEVVTTDDPAAVRGPAIVLGTLATALGAKPNKTSVSGEGFRLRTRGDQLLIGGQSDAAVLLGVYALLERLGCDWVMPGAIGEIIPARKTVSIATLDVAEAPDFAMRKLWYRGGRRLVSADESARFQQWLRRQMGGSYEPVANQTAGHAWGGFIKRHQVEFDRDPTMYALRPDADGVLKRLGPQIETTHPLVIALMVQDIKDRFAKQGWPTDKAVGFPIGPADGLGFSQSPESIAASAGRVDAAAGLPDQTDLMVLFANRIFAALGSAYPNVLLGYYSYSAHADYPARYTPDPRLVQIFAPINYSRYHSVVDPSSRSQPAYRRTVEQWGALSRKQGNPLLYRGYNWNLAENMMPYAKLRIWGAELPFYKSMGISGLNVEATKAWGVNGPSDWLFIKLAWDSSRDWKALLHDYCVKSFGAGAAPMEAYFLRLTERQYAAGQEAGSYHAIPLIFDRAFIAAARRDMAQAGALAQTADQKTRIGYVAGPIDILDRYLDYYAATTRLDFAAAKAAYEAIGAAWHQAHAQNSDLAAKEAPEYLDRFVGPFATEAALYSSAPYAIVAPLPDTLQTAFATEAEGLRRGYDRAETNEAGFAPTKTYSLTWDAQRLVKPDGAVWYRYRFQAPAAVAGKTVSLFLGSFDDTATVWLNGKLVGTSGRQFSKPVTFDLAGQIKPGSENLLAIHVERSAGISEIGIGGLLRPSFLFSGPAWVAPK
ncbi:DUF4838 domain-containing protein [Sphingomonas sp. PB4P5]|uniref:DUF4838 domain-containing protein n=1 Tax=Parasphingomonas puruogangriensis TaxID=3096155 RepID=UPI002FCB354C